MSVHVTRAISKITYQFIAKMVMMRMVREYCVYAGACACARARACACARACARARARARACARAHVRKKHLNLHNAAVATVLCTNLREAAGERDPLAALAC